jgi:hypothetical protein
MLRLFCLILICGTLFAPQRALAETWLLVEVRAMPQGCSNPMRCLHQTTVVVRNFLSLTYADKRKFARRLNSMAVVRALPDSVMETVLGHTPNKEPDLHDIPVSPKAEILRGHPGVYFDASGLERDSETASFAAYVRKEFDRIGLRILTEQERDATPGRPTLALRFQKRSENEGCISPFAVSLSITEEVIVARAPDVKIAVTVWSGRVAQNLANLHYTPESALRDMIDKLVADYQSVNAS